MITYFRRKIEKYRIKTNFKKYGSHVETYTLKEEGTIEFAVWDNPLESSKLITQDTVDFYKQFVPKGCLSIDIGAHIGDTTVPIALATGKNGTTVAFDPNPMVFKVLAINAKLNPDKTNILPFNHAIAVEPGEYFYNSAEATYNNGGISKDKVNSHGKYQLYKKVTAVNLLDFLKKEINAPLDNLGFIKIDVEGFDLDILTSIKELILTYRPTVIAECFKKLDQIKREKLFTLFDEMDFELFYLKSFDSKSKFEKITKKEDMRKWKHFDFCAIPKGEYETVYNKR